MKKRIQPFLTLSSLCLVLTFLSFPNVGFTQTCNNQVLFASSNTSGNIGVFDVANNNMITSGAVPSAGMDADGIFYDTATDKLYQLNRTNNVVNEYSNVSTNPMLTATSSSDFSNGREIAVFGNKLVVAQDANTSNNDQNKLIVYTIGNGSITLDKTFDVSINLWGIHADGNRLLAIVDNSNNLAIFEDFFNNVAGAISPTATIAVDGLVRTHGVTYDADEDYLVLTDIGEASSATDGFLVAVPNFMSAMADGTISMSEQRRVGGGSSKLGNPVDVAYNPEDGYIYVAERANGGGQILGFKKPVLSGGIAPAFQADFAGASAVNFSCASGADPCQDIDGGMVSFMDDGSVEKTIFVDGNADMLSFSSTVPTSSNYTFTYVVTDANGMILGIPPGNMVDFDGAGLGVCNVYGLTYTGNLNIAMGDDLFAAGLQISDACFDLSSNSLSVNRVTPQSAVTNVFASSNTSGLIGIVGVLADGNTIMDMFNSQGADADGIYYDDANDMLYQLNRTDNVVNAYSGINAAIMNGTMPNLVATSTSDFINGREIAVAGDKLIVAQDANTANGDANRLIIYTISNNSITLDKILDVNINLWGIHLDGGTLYAIEDNSNNLAVYNNIFGNAAGTVAASQIISVDGIVRTHGLTYNNEEDLMILTDIGEASSATDGFLVVIPKFSTKAGDDNISSSEQIRVGGPSSKLGNPVDVAYDATGNIIFVAERANSGGLILGFNMPVLSGGVAPSSVKNFAGASAVNIAGPQGDACNFVDGGMVEFTTGGTQATIFVDGNPDMLSFNSTVPTSSAYQFTYVVTDANGMILGIPPGNMVDFDGAGLGVCNVYGLTYTGNLNIAQGDDLFAAGLQISDDCFDLSSNSLSVNRVSPQGSVTNVFASSNTSGLIGVIGVLSGGTNTMDMFNSQGMDADGISYVEETDMLYQLNRTDNVINVYTGIGDFFMNGTMPTLVTTSTSDFTNGREIAVAGNKLVVAQDAAASNNMTNSFMVYTIGMNSITFDKTYNLNFNTWGIHLSGTTLFAIQDNSDNVAVFENFFDNAAGTITETQVVFVQDMVRTHGLTYMADEDLMILTDIGEASSSTDGHLVVIKNWTSASSDNTIEFTEQVRVGGGSSQLGNPVDVAFDDMERVIYVAERASGGGKILGFKMPALSGGIAPFYVKTFAGASAVHIGGGQGDFCGLVDGGMVAFADGGTERTIFVDGNPDMLSFSSTVPMSSNFTFTYVVTDANGLILGIPPGNMVDFDGAGLGVCNVYGLTYTGNLNIAQGDDLFAAGLQISDECFDLSNNSLAVNRINSQTTIADVYVSSNTGGVIGVVGMLSESSATMNMFAAQGMDADGIHYDVANDMLYQLNRSTNVIDVYGNVSANLANGGVPQYMMSSSSNFTNGREMVTLGGDKLVVAQDGSPANNDQNRLVVYDISGGGISFMTSYDVSINLWGIENVGNDLYAIVDNSNQVAIFTDFLSNNGTTATPNQTISVDGLVRTHGLTYNATNDYMVLTDIGAASSAGDGALVAIPNFTSAAADNNVSASEQIRVSGGASQLGNPVDVEYDSSTGLVYVAERANGGGKVLVFRMPRASGGIAPVYVKEFAGASAIYLNAPNSSDITEPNPQSDFNSFVQSPTVTLSELFPVPATTRINAVLEVNEALNSTVRIYSVTGTLLKILDVELIKGRNEIQIDLSEIPSGVLFFNVPELGKTIQFVKI